MIDLVNAYEKKATESKLFSREIIMRNRFVVLSEVDMYGVNGGGRPLEWGDLKEIGSAILGPVYSIVEGLRRTDEIVSGTYTVPSGHYSEPDDCCPDDWDGTFTDTTIAFMGNDESSDGSSNSSNK